VLIASLTPLRTRSPLRRMTAFLIAIMLLGIPLGTMPGGLTVRAESASNQVSPEALIASLDGLETAYARRYVSADPHQGFIDATPEASPVAARGATPSAQADAMTSAEVTVLQFATDADAEHAWRLTTGTLVASAVLSEDPAALTGSEVPGLGDSALLYLLPDATGSETEAHGVIFVRSGSTGIIVSGAGATSNAALGERLQEFAQFIVDHPASPDPVTVLHEGTATGGDFARMPGPDDRNVLQGLIPMWDYDLTVSNSPIEPNVTPACGCAAPDASTTPVANGPIARLG